MEGLYSRLTEVSRNRSSSRRWFSHRRREASRLRARTWTRRGWSTLWSRRGP